MRPIEIEHREASSGRVPSPAPGHALVFTRYQQEHAVVLNPEDFHRLRELDQALSQTRIIPSDIALAAHHAEDTPANAIEDHDQITALLGL
jgi:hypothetical protein